MMAQNSRSEENPDAKVAFDEMKNLETMDHQVTQNGQIALDDKVKCEAEEPAYLEERATEAKPKKRGFTLRRSQNKVGAMEVRDSVSDIKRSSDALSADREAEVSCWSGLKASATRVASNAVNRCRRFAGRVSVCFRRKSPQESGSEPQQNASDVGLVEAESGKGDTCQTLCIIDTNGGAHGEIAIEGAASPDDVLRAVSRKLVADAIVKAQARLLTEQAMFAAQAKQIVADIMLQAEANMSRLAKMGY